jgi:hypothetical protein
MEHPSHAIPAEEVTAARSRPQRAIQPISVRRLSRLFAAWWADDSMNVRFEQQRARDLQMLRRHDKRRW